MNIKRQEVPALLAAHKVIEGDLSEKNRYNISRNYLLLSRVQKDFEKHRLTLINAYTPSDHAGKPFEMTPEHPEWQKFVDEVFAFLQQDVEVDIRRLSYVGLNLGKNPIPPAAVAALDSILDMDEVAEEVAK